MTTTKRPAAASTPVYLESGVKRVFACAVEWPGWCRSGRDADAALAALAASAPRYAAVAAAAGVPFPIREAPEDWTWDVAERISGSATTDFGAPGAAPATDRAPRSRTNTDQLARLVAAAWTVLDEVAAAAPPSLRKGPRGGGRDRDAVVRHVAEAELAYARQLGLTLGPGTTGTRRAAILGALHASTPNGEHGPRWPVPYAARRIAWHVLDHAWEIEDRSESPRPTSSRSAKTRKRAPNP